MGDLVNSDLLFAASKAELKNEFYALGHRLEALLGTSAVECRWFTSGYHRLLIKTVIGDRDRTWIATLQDGHITCKTADGLETTLEDWLKYLEGDIKSFVRRFRSHSDTLAQAFTGAPVTDKGDKGKDSGVDGARTRPSTLTTE